MRVGRMVASSIVSGLAGDCKVGKRDSLKLPTLEEAGRATGNLACKSEYSTLNWAGKRST